MNIYSNKLTNCNNWTLDLNWSKAENKMFRGNVFAAIDYCEGEDGYYIGWANSNMRQCNLCNFKGLYNISSLFVPCYYLQTIDTSNWDTSTVQDLSYLFYPCRFNDINVSNWNTTSFKNLAYTFAGYYGQSPFQNLDVSNWDTRNIQDLTGTFYYCGRLTDLDVSNWNLNNVISLSNCFSNCSNLTSLNVSNWTFPKLKNLDWTFCRCNNLISLDVSNWTMNNVINLRGTFAYCNNLTSLDVSNWNMNNVKSVSRICENCNKLTQFDFSNWNFNTIKDWSNAFVNCSFENFILNDINLDHCNFCYTFWNCVHNINFTNVNFTNCGLVGMMGGIKSRTVNCIVQNCIIDNSSMEAMFCGVANWDFINVDCYGSVSAGYLFANTTSQTLTLSGFNTNNVTYLYGICNNCTSLKEVDFSLLNVEKVVGANHMFFNCYSLINANLAEWSLINCTSAWYTFYNCYKLKTINVVNWNVCKVTNLNYFCWNCRVLENIDFTNWNCNKCTTASWAFSNCNNLTVESLQSLAKMCLNATNMTWKNLMNTNTYSPLRGTNKQINATTVGADLITQLQAAGWTTN